VPDAAPGQPVFDLPVVRSSAWIFNCYGVVGDDGAVILFDPGLPSTTHGALRVLDRPEDRPLVLVATHAHADHVGGMPGLVLDPAGDDDNDNDNDVSTFLPDRCRQYLLGETPRTFGRDANVRFLPMLGQQPFSMSAIRELVGVRAVGYGGTTERMQLPFTPSGYLADGSPVPHASDWNVIATPGHTDDSVAFHHPKSATLIAGDAVLTHDGEAWFNPEWVDAEAAATTEERLRALEVRHLLPGHGVPIEGDVWRTARSMRSCPTGKGPLARCARRFGRWDS
jgi:glyoxylase-like metal-dependent hydrolase (beta-lactamase superfamily II)